MCFFISFRVSFHKSLSNFSPSSLTTNAAGLLHVSPVSYQQHQTPDQANNAVQTLREVGFNLLVNAIVLPKLSMYFIPRRQPSKNTNPRTSICISSIHPLKRHNHNSEIHGNVIDSVRSDGAGAETSDDDIRRCRKLACESAEEEDTEDLGVGVSRECAGVFDRGEVSDHTGSCWGRILREGGHIAVKRGGCPDQTSRIFGLLRGTLEDREETDCEEGVGEIVDLDISFHSLFCQFHCVSYHTSVQIDNIHTIDRRLKLFQKTCHAAQILGIEFEDMDDSLGELRLELFLDGQTFCDAADGKDEG